MSSHYLNKLMDKVTQREREEERAHLLSRVPSTSEIDRKARLTKEGVEFIPGSYYYVIIYATVPDENMENPCKLAAGLQARMSQGHLGHVERPGTGNGWHCLKIMYDLRDLINHGIKHGETDRRGICGALWHHFARAERRCLREQRSDWDTNSTISIRKNDGNTTVVVWVEEWLPGETGEGWCVVDRF